jgi:hypothetical protein
MKSKKIRLFDRGRWVLLSAFMSVGFALSSLGAADTGPGSFTVERIGVMPFFKGSYGSDITASITCPVCELTFDPDNLTPDCDRVLTRFAQDLLELRYGDKLIPSADIRRAYREMPKDEFKDTPVDLSRRLGKAMSANAMIVGTVWKYRDRRGGTRAVESPASVAFAVHLVDVETGSIVWNNAFAETQRSLSENILKAPAFFARGAKWLTADELARFGMEEIFKDFPY